MKKIKNDEKNESDDFIEIHWSNDVISAITKQHDEMIKQHNEILKQTVI